MQELIVARKAIIRSGQETLTWVELFAAFDAVFQNTIPGSATQTSRMSLALTAVFRHARNSLPRIFDLTILIRMLALSRQSKSSNLGIRVYAFIGLLSETARQNVPQLEPEYCKDVQKLHMDTTTVCLEALHNLDIFLPPDM